MSESMVIGRRESEKRVREAASGGPVVPRKRPVEGDDKERPPPASVAAAPTPDRPAKAAKPAPEAKTPQKGVKAKPEGKKDASKKNGAPAKKEKGEKPKKKPAEKSPGTSGMVGYIVDLVCSRRKSNAIERGELFDKLKKEFPSKTDSAIDSWIGYFPGYADQAGHTIHSEGRGVSRRYWGEKNTHPPHGRRFGKKAAKK